MVVLVTSLIDIGRGNWNNKYRRSIESYLDAFKNVCQLDNNMIIYTSKDLLNKIKDFRVGKENKTVYYEYDLADCRLYKKRDIIDGIIEKNKTRTYYHIDVPTAVEFTQANYNIVVCNKVEFIRKSLELNPFGSQDFCLDRCRLYRRIY